MTHLDGVRVKTFRGEYVVHGLKPYEQVRPEHFTVVKGDAVPSPSDGYAYSGFCSELRFAQDISEAGIKSGYPFWWRKGDAKPELIEENAE